jgi:hypothetical protein
MAEPRNGNVVHATRGRGGGQCARGRGGLGGPETPITRMTTRMIFSYICRAEMGGDERVGLDFQTHDHARRAQHSTLGLSDILEACPIDSNVHREYQLDRSLSGRMDGDRYVGLCV